MAGTVESVPRAMINANRLETGPALGPTALPREPAYFCSETVRVSLELTDGQLHGCNTLGDKLTGERMCVVSGKAACSVLKHV